MIEVLKSLTKLVGQTIFSYFPNTRRKVVVELTCFLSGLDQVCRWNYSPLFICNIAMTKLSKETLVLLNPGFSNCANKNQTQSIGCKLIHHHSTRSTEQLKHRNFIYVDRWIFNQFVDIFDFRFPWCDVISFM